MLKIWQYILHLMDVQYSRILLSLKSGEKNNLLFQEHQPMSAMSTPSLVFSESTAKGISGQWNGDRLVPHSIHIHISLATKPGHISTLPCNRDMAFDEFWPIECE